MEEQRSTSPSIQTPFFPHPTPSGSGLFPSSGKVKEFCKLHQDGLWAAQNSCAEALNYKWGGAVCEPHSTLCTALLAASSPAPPPPQQPSAAKAKPGPNQ